MQGTALARVLKLLTAYAPDMKLYLSPNVAAPTFPATGVALYVRYLKEPPRRKHPPYLERSLLP